MYSKLNVKGLTLTIATSCIIAAVFFPSSINAKERTTTPPVEIGSKLQLFVNDRIISKLDGLELRLQKPQPQPMADSPLKGVYTTIIKDGDLYRAYYRDYDPSYNSKPPRSSGHPAEVTCYAESRDGHEWTFPNLGIYESDGSRDNNFILAGQSPFSHNFSPFLDTRPDADPNKRFKALAGHPGFNRKVEADGLHAFASADGIHWEKISEKAVIPYDMSWHHAFDSQNVAFWSEAEQLYVCYFRVWTPFKDKTNETSKKSPEQHKDSGKIGELRSIARTTSPDFKNWSKPVMMHPNLEGEHLYTNQTHPYFREPHIYIALPTRYIAGRVGAKNTNSMLGSTDILFMSSRAGSEKYDRLFTEAFIRPGLNPERWGNRANYVALNVVPTGYGEMSIYHAKSGRRYTLRTDGFISIHAGAEEGEFLTRPLIFTGDELVINYSTAAAGSVQVEILRANGTPIKEFSLTDCSIIVGDEIEHVVNWEENPNLNALKDEAVRLRFVMNEADLYSFKFRKSTSQQDKVEKSPSKSMVFPGEEWQRGNPEDFGISRQAMDKIDELMKKSQANGVLARNGYLLGEWNYGAAAEKQFMVQSVSKSITSMVLGLAVQDGVIPSIDAKVKDYWHAFDTTSVYAGPYTDEITFRQLSNMTCGMATVRSYGLPYFDPCNVKPGTEHHYHNDPPQALARALTYLYGKTLQEVLQEKALNYMNARMEWEAPMWETTIKAANGKTVAVNYGYSHTWWTAQDIARVGHLYLNKGGWNGKQILPKSFVEETFTDIPLKINPWFGQSEARLKITGYGLAWWTSRGEDLRVWWMGGRGRQFCMVLPDYGIVITKVNDWKPRPDNYDRVYFFRAIKNCLEQD